MLLQKSFEARPTSGALIVYETLIDDERKFLTLSMGPNMLVNWWLSYGLITRNSSATRKGCLAHRPFAGGLDSGTHQNHAPQAGAR